MRPSVEIVRLEESDPYGTFGVLKINKEIFCVTLEKQDLLNQATVSSIPAQQYICKRVNSPKFGETFEVTNVPGRSAILFHAGNKEGDSHGCILLAEKFGKLKEDRAILNSGDTFAGFLGILLPFDKFVLTITEAY